MPLTKIGTLGIDDNAITTAKIAADTVVAADIAANAVDSSELASGAVDLAHMSVNSIDSDQYVDGSIDTAHIANVQVTLAKMAVNSIDSDQYVDASIDLAHMSVNSIDSDQYVDGSIDLAHMSVNSIDSDQYVDASIDNAHVATGLDAVKLADGSVTNAELQYINSLSANAQTQITARLPLAGGTMSGETIFADQLVTRPLIKDYAETKVAMGAHAVDISLGNVQTYTLSGNQTLTFTNPIASGNSSSFTLIVTNGGSATLTWPTSVDWAGGDAPSLTSSGVDILTFMTVDGGTIWYGFAAGLAMA